MFSWIEWPDKATRNAGMETAMKDPHESRHEPHAVRDGKRMIFGGFVPVVDFGPA